MTSRILIALSILASSQLHAFPRTWKSADGERSVQGEFVKRDDSSVTIRKPDRKELVIRFDQLHADDRAWLERHQPLGKSSPAAAKATSIPGASSPDAVFDELKFGDTRDAVTRKLKASKTVQLTVDETFIGRTGLNGVFRMREKIGGLEASLFFDWDDAGGLKEITIQTAGFPAAKFNEQLKPCWKECIKLLTNLHGEPINASDSLSLSSIADGSMAATHMWKLPKKGSVLLGAARDRDQYQIAIRFTQKNIQPVVISESSSLGG